MNGLRHCLTAGYFQNADGLCKLTVMVADAFNGVDIPNSSTVRFEVAIDAGGTARMDTAEGKSLPATRPGNARQAGEPSFRLSTGHVRGHAFSIIAGGRPSVPLQKL